MKDFFKRLLTRSKPPVIPNDPAKNAVQPSPSKITFRFKRIHIILLILIIFVVPLTLKYYKVIWLSPYFSKNTLFGLVGIGIVFAILYQKRLWIVAKLRRWWEWIQQWAIKFENATPEQQWKMIRIPAVLFGILYIVVVHGSQLTPAEIVTTFPGNNSIEAPLDGTIEIVFSKGVIQPLAENTLSISPPLTGKISWETNQKMIFTPTQHFKRGQTYTVSIGMVVGTNFIPKFGKQTISFGTIGNPRIVVASPRQEALEPFSPITIVFDRQMVPLTTAKNMKDKQPAFTINPSLPGKGTWLGTTAYQFQPEEPFKKGTTYTVTVPKGMASQDGGVLEDGYSWQFSSERPHVISVSPMQQELYASPTASVAAFFSQEISKENLDDKFTVFDSNHNKIPGQIQVIKNIVGFYPSSPLKREQTYSVVLDKGIQGTEGPNGTDEQYTWSFTTVALPKIISTSPQNNLNDVIEQYTIAVNFKTPMDQDSFKDHVKIDPSPGLDPSLYFSGYNGQNTLSVGTYLGRSTHYTITVDGEVKDQYGVPLGNSYSFSFNTAPYQPSVSIYPAQTFFGAFNQQVTQRVVAQVINTKHVDYALYKLEFADVIDLYAKHYGQLCGDDISCRNWQSYDPSKLKKIKSWSQDFDSDTNVPTHVVTKVTMPNGDNLPSGFYFLAMKIPQGAHDNMVMLVSKATLTVKKSPKQIFSWAVNQANGNTVGNMDMMLTNEGGGVIAQGKTNKDGVFMQDAAMRSDETVFMLGKSNDDTVFAASAWKNGIDTYDFGLPSYYSANEMQDYNTAESYKTFLVLDRPIYRPGQKVYFKGIIKKDTDGAYEAVQPGEKITITISDAMNRTVYTHDLPISSFGSFAADFSLGSSANLGYYTIASKYRGNSASQGFQVEEYKKPDMLITVTPQKTDYVQGETATVSLNAAYYFGAPVTNTPISYSVVMDDAPFQWEKDWRFEFGDPDAYWGHPWWYYTGGAYTQQSFITSGEAKTNADGLVTIHLPLDISKKSASQKMTISASVSDLTNQNVSATQEITVHKAALYAGLHASSYTNTAGQNAGVEIVTIDDSGKTVANTPVTITFYKRTWESVREQNPDDGLFYYTSKPSDTQVDTKQGTTDKQGYTTVSFTPSEGGTYKVVASVTDSSGNTNNSGTFLWVSGQGFEAPRQNNDRIVITTDKPKYFVGDKLSLFVASPFSSQSAKTLLTAERGSVLDYKIVNTSDSSNNFSMTIQDPYVPNAFIGAVLVKPGSTVTNPAEFKVGYTPVQVTNKNNQLTVSIKTDKSRYKPRQTLQATIETKDGNGKPVSTELAVGLVDKAVWDLANAQLPDIYKVFYEPRNLDVSTAQLLTMSIDRVNANVNLGAKGGSGGGCFTGDTPILMKGGTPKPIQDIHVGDTVLTRKSETDPTLVEAKVLKTFKHTVDKYLIINGMLKVTPIHKMYVNGKWTVAGTIVPGDILLDKDTQQIRVYSLEQVMGSFTVYNLETETYHTYFANGIYVHNQKGGGFETARTDFPDTAYWNPYVKTDENGKATISIALPDNLTTWRLAAIANSEKAAFGQAQAEVLVSRDVLIRPFLPRFLSIGDKPTLGAVITNTSGKDQTINVTIDTKGLQIDGNKTQQVAVADKQQVKVTWTGTTQNVTKATIGIALKNTDNVALDALITKIPVNPFSTPEVVATAGRAQDSATETILLPKPIDTTQGEATLSFSPTLGSNSISALSYLFSYPYDCTEQLTSKFMPSIWINATLKNNGLSDVAGISQSSLTTLISNQIQTLTNQQHSDGGWGWFIETPTDPYMSAYALQGLLEAKKQGFTVSNDTINRAKTYLVNELSYTNNRHTKLDKNIQAYILSVLAGETSGLSGYEDNLFQRRFELSLEGRAYLTIAMEKSGGMQENVAKLYAELLSLGKFTATTAHWEDKGNYTILGSATTTTATMLELILSQDKGNPLVQKIITYLMASRYDGHWSSTRDTAAVIRSIGMQLLWSSLSKPNEDYKVAFNGKTVAGGKFTEKDLLKIITYTLPATKIPLEKKNTLTLTKSGNGNLFYNLNLRYFLPFTTIDPLDQGMVISREFVNDNGKVIPGTSITEGSEMWVRLTIAVPALRHFVIINDMLPAGLESVNESLKNVSMLGKPTLKSQNKENQYWYFTHKEYHDDRTSVFAQELPAGVYEISYRVRATTPGKYHYPPAQVYELYTPDVSGHSSGGLLEVKKEE